MNLHLSNVPITVRNSWKLWLIAIAAGVFETLLVIVTTSVDHSMSLGSLVAGASVRTVIFAIMTYVIFQMVQGKNWARIVLAIGLGLFGTLSLLIGPIEWFSQGHSLAEALAGLTASSALFGLSRIVHVAAVLAGLVLMFTTTANQYFKSQHR